MLLYATGQQINPVRTVPSFGILSKSQKKKKKNGNKKRTKEKSNRHIHETHKNALWLAFFIVQLDELFVLTSSSDLRTPTPDSFPTP